MVEMGATKKEKEEKEPITGLKKRCKTAIGQAFPTD